jgi:hypothetical protein
MESAEKKLTEIPVYTIISLVTPHGLESSIISFTSTIISLDIYTIKALSGVYVNEIFVGATKTNLKNTLW